MARRICSVAVPVLVLLFVGPASSEPPTGEHRPARTDVFGDPLPEGVLARMGTIRGRQGSAVSALAFSPDGKLLASAGIDRTIHLWDAATGSEIRRLTGHSGAVNSVAFSPDGKTLASGSADRTLRLWDVATGEEKRRCQVPPSPFERSPNAVHGVAFSPDGEALVSGGEYGYLYVWDAPTGKLRHEFHAHPSPVLCVSWSPSGDAIAWGSAEGKPGVCDSATGKKLYDLPGLAGAILTVAFSPDGKTLVVTGADEGTRLYDAAGGRRRYVLPATFPVAFAPDGKTLAEAGEGVVLYDTATGKELRQFRPAARVPPKPKPGQVHVAFAPDGKSIATGDLTGVIRLWDVAAGKARWPEAGHQDRVGAMTVSPDGKWLATGGRDRTICVWDSATGKELHRLAGHEDDVLAVAFSPDGRALATGDEDGMIFLWDPVTGRRWHRLEGQDNAVVALAFAPDGQTLASADRNARVRRWDVATGERLPSVQGDGIRACAAAFSPDGKLLACGERGADSAVAEPGVMVYLYETRMGSRVKTFEGHKGNVWAVAFSPDGRTLASAGTDGTIRFWDVVARKERRQLRPDPAPPITSLAFSPDGRLLLSGSSDGEGSFAADTARAVRLWEVASGKEVRRLTGHGGAVWSVAFFPDGRRMAGAGSDTTALVWDLAQGAADRQAGKALRPQDLDALWADLAEDDAAKAYRAVCTLEGAPRQSVPFLRERLEAVGARRRQVGRLVADLDSDDFQTRERAQAALEELGELVEPQLRAALKDPPSAEVRRRTEHLLDSLEDGPTPARLRLLRSLEVLEFANTPDVRRVLEIVAEGALGVEMARETKAALRRLDKRPAP